MGTFDPESLSDEQTQAITNVATAGGNAVEEMARVFEDPAEAFICSPVPLSMRQLSRMYLEQWEEDERHRVPAILRRRSRDERWREQRAMFQAKRTAVRRDAILEAEAQVWAIVGLEFHSQRIRKMWDRWEALDAYVTDSMERLESGDAAFTTSLRDACRELRDIESKLEEIMPQLGIPNRAQQFWTAKTGSRGEILGRIEEKLASVAGGDTAAGVFDIIDGGIASGE